MRCLNEAHIGHTTSRTRVVHAKVCQQRDCSLDRVTPSRVLCQTPNLGGSVTLHGHAASQSPTNLAPYAPNHKKVPTPPRFSRRATPARAHATLTERYVKRTGTAGHAATENAIPLPHRTSRDATRAGGRQLTPRPPPVEMERDTAHSTRHQPTPTPEPQQPQHDGFLGVELRQLDPDLALLRVAI